MPDPLAHHPSMLVIKGTSLPRFWWLMPWTTARSLAETVAALKTYADRADAALKASELARVQAEHSRLHWVAKAERAHAVAMHNERVILDMEKRLRG
jgi:hypothetical protein